MSEPIQRVIGKRHCDRKLGKHLQCNRPRCEARRQDCGLEVPARVGRDEVGGTEEVEAAGQGDAGDAVEGAAVPGDLRFVDAEVGRNGAV